MADYKEIDKAQFIVDIKYPEELGDNSIPYVAESWYEIYIDRDDNFYLHRDAILHTLTSKDGQAYMEKTGVHDRYIIVQKKDGELYVEIYMESSDGMSFYGERELKKENCLPIHSIKFFAKE